MSLKNPDPNKSKLVRKASPPRPEAEDTFRRKLEEIKKIRQKQNNNSSAKKKVIVNGKPALDVQGEWALFQSSKGRKYFFNLKTLENQWTKPASWIEEGQVNKSQPPLPRSSSDQPPLPQDQNGSSTNGANKNPGFKMKIKKGSSKVKKKKNVNKGAAPPPLPPLPDEDPKDKLPKAYMDFSDDDDGETCAKLPKLNEEDYKETEESWIDNYQPYESMFEPDETSSSAAVGYNPTSSNSLPPPPNPLADRYDSSVPPPPVPVPVLPDPALAAVLAAKAMIESQLPPPSATPGITSANALLNNATWLTDYNLPACLSRCKFPKTQDALHELNSNRTKKRTEPNLPPIPPEVAQFAGSGFDVRRDMFIAELKNSNNRHRLLTEKLNGTGVYKIPDELWDRSFPLFNVELLGPNIKLECRPHGFTEDNVPVYTRTGKVANKLPFPEDIVRCHSVLQAWKTDTCHCVYANRTFTIERDDRQWKKDLEECKKFLIENGY